MGNFWKILADFLKNWCWIVSGVDNPKKNDTKDEIMGELKRIKDELSSSCDGDIEKLVQKMNKIAKGQRLPGEDIVQRKKNEIA